VAVEGGPHEGVGRGVDVDREGRDRRLADLAEGIVRRAGELVASDRLARWPQIAVPRTPAEGGHLLGGCRRRRALQRQAPQRGWSRRGLGDRRRRRGRGHGYRTFLVRDEKVAWLRRRGDLRL